MKIFQVLIRCDASFVIGSGHVMRCRTLARQLVRVGANVIFLCRRQPGDLIDLLSQEFCVLILPQQPLIVSNCSIGRKTHQAFLGCSQQDDADQCADLISDSAVESIDWIVVDHYGIDANWENRLLQRIRISSTPKLLVIDDLADRLHQADLLLDQNFVDHSVKSRYANLVPTHCRVFEGPHYALLGSEYSQLHNTISKRTELNRVLVSFGGVDAENLTALALEALMLPEFSHIKVDIVLGHKAPHRNTVAELVLRRPFTTLHDPMPTLSDLMVRADLAIGACGSTTWERACLGLPSITVATASNQLRSAQLLHKFDYLTFLGNSSEVQTAHFVNALRQRLDTPWPIDQSYNLTDGYGASRLVMAMLRINSPITLRLVEPSDEALLLCWSNDSDVRANSFSHDFISKHDHRDWFSQGLTNPNRLHFIALTPDSVPVGQIRFDRTLRSGPDGVDEAFIGFSLDSCARGCGLSVPLVQLGLQALHQYWGVGTHAVAEVLSSNHASNNCFAKCGFILDDASTFRNSQSMKRWRWASMSSPASSS